MPLFFIYRTLNVYACFLNAYENLSALYYIYITLSINIIFHFIFDFCFHLLIFSIINSLYPLFYFLIEIWPLKQFHINLLLFHFFFYIIKHINIIILRCISQLIYSWFNIHYILRCIRFIWSHYNLRFFIIISKYFYHSFYLI